MPLRLAVLLAWLGAASSFAAIYQVGDTIPDTCWNTVDKKVCLQDTKGDVQVLLYSTGWCSYCQEEMIDLVPHIKDYEGKPVRFISLSAQGWDPGSMPDATFLNAWKDKFKIPFPVAASPKDAGKLFFEPPIYIPNVIIIDKNGKLVYKEVNPGAEVLLMQVNKLLGLR